MIRYYTPFPTRSNWYSKTKISFIIIDHLTMMRSNIVDLPSSDKVVSRLYIRIFDSVLAKLMLSWIAMSELQHHPGQSNPQFPTIQAIPCRENVLNLAGSGIKFECLTRDRLPFNRS